MNRTTMIGLVLAGVLAGAGLGVLAFRAPSSTTEVQTQVTGKATVGGPFSLVDQTGKHVTDKDFRGRYMLVFFGYTNCPDICPAGLQVMSAALDKLGHAWRRHRADFDHARSGARHAAEARFIHQKLQPAPDRADRH